MFEGMSDDEDDFQSVSWFLSTVDHKLSRSLGNLYVFVTVCNRGAQQVPPTGQGFQQEYDQCLWATVEQQVRGQ